MRVLSGITAGTGTREVVVGVCHFGSGSLQVAVGLVECRLCLLDFSVAASHDHGHAPWAALVNSRDMGVAVVRADIENIFVFVIRQPVALVHAAGAHEVSRRKIDID